MPVRPGGQVELQQQQEDMQRRQKQQLSHQMQQAEQAAESVRALLDGNRLVGSDEMSLNEAMHQLQNTMSILVPLAPEAVLRKSQLVKDTVASAMSAATFYYQAPERRCIAQQWLQQNRLQH